MAQYADCAFCPASGKISADRLILESSWNRGFPTYGSLNTPGYVVIAPTEHILGYGEADEATLADFLTQRSYVKGVIEEKTGKTAIGFEHCNLLGKSVAHAHYHLVPGIMFEAFRDGSSGLIEELGGSYSYTERALGSGLGVVELMKEGFGSGAGLYFDGTDERGEPRAGLFAVELPNGASDASWTRPYEKFFRVVAAECLGLERSQADWKTVSTLPGMMELDKRVREDTVRLFGKAPGPTT